MTAMNVSRFEGTIKIEATSVRSCGSFLMVRTDTGFQVYHASFEGCIPATPGPFFQDIVVTGLEEKGWDPIDCFMHHDLKTMYKVYRQEQKFTV